MSPHPLQFKGRQSHIVNDDFLAAEGPRRPGDGARASQRCRRPDEVSRSIPRSEFRVPLPTQGSSDHLESSGQLPELADRAKTMRQLAFVPPITCRERQMQTDGNFRVHWFDTSPNGYFRLRSASMARSSSCFFAGATGHGLLPQHFMKTNAFVVAVLFPSTRASPLTHFRPHQSRRGVERGRRQRQF